MMNSIGFNQFYNNRYPVINRNKVAFKHKTEQESLDLPYGNVKATRATIYDLPDMLKLVERIIIDEEGEHIDDVESFSATNGRELFRIMNDKRSALHVIKDEEGKLLGTASLCPFLTIEGYNDNNDVGYISYVFLDKSIRGRHGNGKAIVQHLIHDAKDFKYKKLFLTVRESNKIAIDLYKGLGFKILDKETKEKISYGGRKFIKDGYYGMELDLSAV